MEIIPIYTDGLTGSNHILFISIFGKISSKKPWKIGISSIKSNSKSLFLWTLHGQIVASYHLTFEI